MYGKLHFNIKKAVYKRDDYPKAYFNGSIFMYKSSSRAIYVIIIGESEKFPTIKTLMYEADVKKFIPIDFEKPKPNPWRYTDIFTVPRAVEYAASGKMPHGVLNDWKLVDESDLTKLYLTMNEGGINDRFTGIY